MINLELGKEGSLAHLDTRENLGVAVTKDTVVMVAHYEVSNFKAYNQRQFAIAVEIITNPHMSDVLSAEIW